MITARINSNAQLCVIPMRGWRNEREAASPEGWRPAAPFIWVGTLIALALGGCGTEAPKQGPTVAAIAPASAIEGTGRLTVLVSGTNFIASSSVQWNGSARTTAFSSATELQAQIEEADLVSAGFSAITVVNPKSGEVSTAATFTVENAVPVISSLSPSSIVYLTASSLNLILNGSGFVPSAVVFWNETSLPTIYLSNSELMAQVPGSALTSVSKVSVTVVQPPPGGGTSLPQAFTVAAPITNSLREIEQAAYDLAWDSSNGLIYLSVPSAAAAYGNGIAALDPDAGTIVASQFTGGEPSRLALSDDNQFLYIGLNSFSSVRRLALPSLSQSMDYSLGTSSIYGSYFALDLAVAPGMAHTTAVSLGVNASPPSVGDIMIFDDGVARPSVASSGLDDFDSLQWSADAGQLYVANNETTSFDFYSLSVNARGVSGITLYQGAVHNSNDFVGHIHYDRGSQLIYVGDGIVLDPNAGLPMGTFAAAGLMVPDSSVSRAFFLTSSAAGDLGAWVQVFDLIHFTLITIIPLPDVKGNPVQLIRWGPRGLAFCTDAGFLYLLTGGFVDGSE